MTIARMFYLGMYGDVMRVKILYHKPDTALVQFADHISALSGTYMLL